MPNWIEGTLKLRGKQEDIKRFFLEGLDASLWAKPEKLEEQVTDNSGDGWLEFSFKHEPHIKDTRRAFITDDYVYMEEDEGVVCVNVKQAWAFHTGPDSNDFKIWEAISEKYNVDIKLFGIERGMCFTQEIVIVRGKRPIENVRQYEDWDWDCPFPNMGG